MADLYHIYINRDSTVTREAVEKILNEAPDWFRYLDTCYIVETEKSPKYWVERLKPVATTGRIFICKFDKTNYWGSMSKDFWKWYQAKAPLPNT